MNKLISIIIPTFNRVHIIRETLDSIKSQTYANWECIVVDDGSTDGTNVLLEDYCKNDSRFQYYFRPKNRLKGPNSCRNIGFEKSKGAYINFFDSDDVFINNAFEKFNDGFSNDVDVVITSIKKFINTIDNIVGKNNVYSKHLIEDYLVGKVNFYTFGPMWKRKFLLQQNEIFDEKIRNLDDYDFNLRMLYQQPKIKFLDTPLILQRVHENSLSQELNKNNIIEIKSTFEARYKHLNLIKNNKIVDIKILEKYIYIQYKRFVKQALKQKDLSLLFSLISIYIRNNFKIG